MDIALRQRLWMWLRGEQAMGLSWVVIPNTACAHKPSAAQRPAVAASAGSRRGSGGTGPSDAPAAATVSPPATDDAATAAALPIELFGAGAELAGQPMSREQRLSVLAELDKQHVSVCTKCRLHEQRTHTVFGEGDPEAQLLFIGEGPGETEDQTGRPFVGRAGELLDRMIRAMGLKREQVYICNIVKCRPPGNRAPVADEVEACTPYLLRQLEIIRPRVIVTLGLPATQFMLNTRQSMGRLRGRWHEWRGIKLMPTYHPAYLLRYYTRETRMAVWSDLQQVMVELGLKAPQQGDAPPA
jgi:uracil-DNA glycosylase family 4